MPRRGHSNCGGRGGAEELGEAARRWSVPRRCARSRPRFAKSRAAGARHHRRAGQDSRPGARGSRFTADYLDYMAEWARRIEGEILESDRAGEIHLPFPPAHRGHRRNPALELSVFPDRPQGGAGAGHRQRHRHQAERRDAAQCGEVRRILQARSTRRPALSTSCTAAALRENAGRIAPRRHDQLHRQRGDRLGYHGRRRRRTSPSSTWNWAAKRRPSSWADADINLAVRAVKDSRVINSGQVCNCAERVYVQESIAAEFSESSPPPCALPVSAILWPMRPWTTVRSSTKPVTAR